MTEEDPWCSPSGGWCSDPHHPHYGGRDPFGIDAEPDELGAFLDRTDLATRRCVHCADVIQQFADGWANPEGSFRCGALPTSRRHEPRRP